MTALPTLRLSPRSIWTERKLIAEAVELEVAEWTESHAYRKNDKGHRQVVRNGKM